MISDPHTVIQLKLNNKIIPIWTYGNPNKLPIFYIHGFFRGFSDYFGDLPIRHLMKDYFIVAFDLPGFGKSKDIDMDHYTY